MIRLDLNDSKYVLVIAALFSSALAFVILRGVLLNPGIIESIDIQWNQYYSMFGLWFHTWNFYTGGSQIVFVSQFPIYSLVLFFKDVGLAQRVIYFLIVFLISFNMFLVTFYSLKRLGQKNIFLFFGSIAASLFYAINPLLFSELFHLSFLWSYSLFPLVFYFTWVSVNSSSRRMILVSSLLLGSFFAFMADAWGMVVGVFIFAIVSFSSIVLNGWKSFVRRFIPNFLFTLLIMIGSALSLASYWLLPYITQKPSGPVWDPFSVANLIVNSKDNGLTNVMGLHSWSGVPFFGPSGANASFFAVWQFLTLVVLIVAVSVILLRRSKLTFTLSGLLVVGVFLAKGVQPPLGEFYLWLTFYSPKLIPNQTFLFKYPYVFLSMVSLAVALLIGILVTEVFKRVKFSSFSFRHFSAKLNGLPIVLFFSIITLIALVGAPVLTGNLNQALNPVTLPPQYRELNQFLSSQEGTFRVMWVPQAANFNWSNNPWANKVEYWGSGAPPLLYGWGIVASPNNGFLGDMIYDYLLTNQTQYLGKLLALGNVRYIVFHNDSKTTSVEASPDSAFDFYFKQYKTYFDSFLKSSTYNGYFLSIYEENGTIRDDGYLNFILQNKYEQNFNTSGEYKSFQDNATLKMLQLSDSINNPQLTFEEKNDALTHIYVEIQSDYNDAKVAYENNYYNSLIYKNLPTSRDYLNNTLHSQAYQNYLNDFSKEYQNFIHSPVYNSTHNYLDSLEYLILTGSEYFSNSTEMTNFVNSAEYKGFLYYYLIGRKLSEVSGFSAVH